MEPIAVFKNNRFLFLLVSMFLLILLHPMMSAADLYLPQLILKVLFSLVFLSAVYAVSQRRRLMLIGAVLMLPAFGLQWAEYFAGGYSTAVAAGLFYFMFFCYIAAAIVRHVLEIDHVTFEQVCGTLCVYMLIGLIWADAFALADLVFPDQFAVKGMVFADYVYFSFVTLTTLGYGDIAPVGAVARSLAIVEAVLGQFFLAVLVARQVGLFISGQQR